LLQHLSGESLLSSGIRLESLRLFSDLPYVLCGELPLSWRGRGQWWQRLPIAVARAVIWTSGFPLGRRFAAYGLAELVYDSLWRRCNGCRCPYAGRRRNRVLSSFAASFSVLL